MKLRFIPNPRLPYLEILERLRRVGWGNLRQLGSVSKYPFYVWTHSPQQSTGSIVLSAGAHGDEPSGVISLLNLLEHRPPWLETFNLTVFPCLNPWGYEHNVRFNERGLDINRHWKNLQAKEVILARRVLKKRRFHLTICLHEDYDATGFYIYELSRLPNSIARRVVPAVARILPIETRTRIEGRTADRGIVSRSIRSVLRRKYWPEALCHIQHHCDCTLTSETPTCFPIDKRVQAQTETIRAALSTLRNRLKCSD
jgi:hypothetical protein